MKNNLLANLINSTVSGDKKRKQQLIRLIQVDLENVNYEILQINIQRSFMAMIYFYSSIIEII